MGTQPHESTKSGFTTTLKMRDDRRLRQHRFTNGVTRRNFLATVGECAIFALPVMANALEDTSAMADIRSVKSDLVVPPVSLGPPAPGKRVRQALPPYEHTDVHHTLYLPRDWQPGRKYPVLVEYPGNGPYRSPYGDYSSGDVEGCDLAMESPVDKVLYG